MNEKQIARWVDKHMAAYIEMYVLGHWDIQCFVETSDDENYAGAVHVRPEYEMASIMLNAAKLDTEEELVETVCHELEHILHAPMNLFYDAIVGLLPKSQHKVAEHLFTNAQEQTRSNIGRFRQNALQKQESRRQKQ